MKIKKIKLTSNEAKPVPVLQAGMSKADERLEGQLVVTLLIDCSARPDLVAVLEAHRSCGEGECKTAWAAWPEREKSITLVVSFVKPVKARALLTFNLARHGAIVDRILESRRLNLVCGKEGDTLDSLPAESRSTITVEVTELTSEEWESLWTQAVAADASVSIDEARNWIDATRKKMAFAVAFPEAPPLERIAGAFVSPELKAAIFVTNDLLVNQIRRDGPRIAESFDQFFDTELRELSSEFGRQAVDLLPAILQAARSGDKLKQTCGHLLGNSHNSIVAAIELIRLGYRLQPSVLLRSSIEAMSTAGYLYLRPMDLTKFLDGKLQSSKTISESKRILPFIGQAWGVLSDHFVHIGPLHREVQLVTKYDSADDPAAKTNLLNAHMALFIGGIVAEFVFFESIGQPRYWRKLSPGRYQLELLAEFRERIDDMLSRLSVDDPKIQR